MIIKVCGMRERSNIDEVAKLKPNLMGFIFYPGSKRFVGNDYNPENIKSVTPEIETVGVFVNELPEIVSGIISRYSLDFVQLHGNESPGYCREMFKKCNVIKAFGIHENFEWNSLAPYVDVCDYFLFDTSAKGFGGSGKKFDWQLLNKYPLSKPFMLSGGIDEEDVEIISNLPHPFLRGVDINSRFEIKPGIKDVSKVKRFIDNINSRMND